MRLLSSLLLLPLFTIGQVPSNDCAESPLSITNCGTNFSISVSDMANATDGSACQAGGSCPIVYVNGVGYENFDCNTSTDVNGLSSGDDWSGSIENSLWWSFTPAESCNYTVSITASNCCCKDKGSTSAAQYSIIDADAPLPGGTIQNYIASNGAFIGTVTANIAVTANNPVYIIIDGLNGSDCDIAVSILPDVNCTGCTIALPVDLISFKGYNDKNINIITWSTETETNNDYFKLERSRDLKDWEEIAIVPGKGNAYTKNDYIVNDNTYNNTINYYRLTQIDYNGEVTIYDKIVINNLIKRKILVSITDMLDRMIPNLSEYKGIMIYKYSDGSVEKVIRE